MEVIITAVGPDNVGLADPIIHYMTQQGGSIAEIQMYDHDEEAVFAMLCRVHLQQGDLESLRDAIQQIGARRKLSVRVWSPDERAGKPRLAICTTYRAEPAWALLSAIESGQIVAEPALMMANRDRCRRLADRFEVPWELIGDAHGNPDEARFDALLDEYQIDYVILARYMRVLPPSTCWKFAGGRIINLHHGLLPAFPGMQPYKDAYDARMLTFGATCHFIVPELDAGNQIINQTTFTVLPGTTLNRVMQIGQTENEPMCLTEGVRRVVSREVQLHFHRVIARSGAPRYRASVPQDAPEGAYRVPNANLLAIRIAPALVSNWDFGNPEAATRQDRRDLQLHAESVFGQFGQDGVQHISTKNFVTRFDIRQLQPRGAIGRPSNAGISPAMPRGGELVIGRQEPTAIDDIGSIFEDRIQ